jgi:hypothetical protein
MSVIMRRAAFPTSPPIPPPLSEISISVTLGSGDITQGFSGQFFVNLVRTNYTSDVTLTAINLPAGVTASFNPSVLSGATLVSEVEVLVAEDAPLGANSLIIEATGVGVSTVTSPLDINILAPGDFEWLNTPYTPPVGITFNTSTGLWEGTTVNTAPWIPDVEESFTDTGVAATNMANLNSYLSTFASTATQNKRLLIDPGVLFAGALTLRNNAHGFRLEVCTSAHASLPPQDSNGTNRGSHANTASSADRAFMPEMYPTGADVPVMGQNNGASHIRFRGILFTNRNDVSQAGTGLIFLQPSANTVLANYCQDIMFEQCVFDGFARVGMSNKIKKLIYAGGTNVAIFNCYMERVGIDGADSACVNIMFGPGPYKVTNNYMSVGGDAVGGVFTGGGGLPGPTGDMLLKDADFSQNIIHMDPDYGDCKNWLELKFGVRILMDGNRLLGVHDGAAQQQAVIIRLTDQFGPNIYTNTQDIHFTNNDFSQVSWPSGIAIVPKQFSSASNPNETNRIYIANNNIVGSLYTGSNGGVPILMNGTLIHDITIKWNNLVASPASSYGKSIVFQSLGTDQYATVIEQNIMVGRDAAPTFLMASNGGGLTGQTCFDNHVNPVGSSFSNNFVSTSNVQYNNQLQANSIAAMQFTNVAAKDYTLLPTSIGYQSAPDGQDYGLQWNIFNIVMARLGT